MLNASARISSPIRSVTGNLLNIAASRLKKRGPVNLNRLMFPAAAGVVTPANAEVSNQRAFAPIPPRTAGERPYLVGCLLRARCVKRCVKPATVGAEIQRSAAHDGHNGTHLPASGNPVRPARTQ